MQYTINAKVAGQIRKNRSIKWNRPDLYIKKPKDNITSSYLTDQALVPLAAWLRDHHGAQAELFRRFNSKVSVNIPLSMIVRWLHANPERRSEPALGYGLLLIKLIEEMKREHLAVLTPAGLDTQALKKLNPSDPEYSEGL